GRVAPEVARVRGQVEQLLLAAEHDLDLLDRASIAFEAVVHPGSDEAGAELGERPVRARTLADSSVAMLEHDLARAHLLDRGEAQAGSLAEADLGGAVEEALGDRLALGALDLRPARDLLLDDGGGCAGAERDDRPADEGPPGRGTGPADEDRVGDDDAVADLDVTAVAPEAACELRQLVADRQAGPALHCRPERRRITLQPLAHRLDVHASRELWQLRQIVAEAG